MHYFFLLIKIFIAHKTAYPLRIRLISKQVSRFVFNENIDINVPGNNQVS